QREVGALLDQYLDAGHGECLLRKREIASLVAETLNKFDGTHYTLFAWIIMPNHVHLVLQPNSRHELPQILHSIKSWTSKAANKLLKRSGPFWQSEYYDHLVRDENDLRHQVEYAWSNAERAGIEQWEWRCKSDSAIAALINPTHEQLTHGRGAHATVQARAAQEREHHDPAFSYIKNRLGVGEC